MKILIVSNLYPPNVVGGYERLAHDVADALAQRGHDIHVLTSDYGVEALPHPRQTIVQNLRLLADRQDIYRPFQAENDEIDAINRSNEAAVERAVREIDPDLIFVWNLYFLGDAVKRAIESSGRPTTLFLTDNWLAYAEQPGVVSGFFSRHVHGSEAFSGGALEGRTPRKSPFNAVFGAEFVQKFYHAAGYEFEHEWVVHNGVQLDVDSPSRREEVKAFGKTEPLRLLFAGRIVDLKGPDLCVAALRPLRAKLGRSIPIELTIVGDGQDQAYKARLDEAIAADNSGAEIKILPPVAEADLSTLWSQHDIYLFPSRYEPFSLTLIMAMAAGIPTVASDAGGNTEIVFPGRTGMVFRNGDADDLATQIATLVRDPELRRTLSRRARTLASRFTFERMIRQLEGVLSACARVRP